MGAAVGKCFQQYYSTDSLASHQSASAAFAHPKDLTVSPTRTDWLSVPAVWPIGGVLVFNAVSYINIVDHIAGEYHHHHL